MITAATAGVIALVRESELRSFVPHNTRLLMYGAARPPLSPPLCPPWGAKNSKEHGACNLNHLRKGSPRTDLRFFSNQMRGPGSSATSAGRQSPEAL